MDYTNIEDVVIEGRINNTVFDAYFDYDNRILHVLDTMGKYGTYRSVTNGVEDIIRILGEYLNLDDIVHRVFLYGTDKLICEYYEWDKSFRIINKNDDLVFSLFTNKMLELYS